MRTNCTDRRRFLSTTVAASTGFATSGCLAFACPTPVFEVESSALHLVTKHCPTRPSRIRDVRRFMGKVQG